MKYAKVVKIRLIIYSILMLLTTIILNKVIGQTVFFVILLAVSCFFLYFLIFIWLIEPMERLELYLSAMQKRAELTRDGRPIPYLEEIESVIELRVADQIEYNSSKIYDKQIEINALQSQINPHFLYNTLESIRGQALMDNNDEIAIMVEALAMFFRYSISGKGNLVPLRDELASINNYIIIQRYRFNNRFSLEILIDEEDEMAYDFYVPRLMIQPIVENAIFHGLEEVEKDGKVRIEVIVTDQNLIITVSDNGKGMTREYLEKLNQSIKTFSSDDEDSDLLGGRKMGIALANINKRICLLFGAEYGLNIYSTLGQGTDVEILIPIKQTRERK